MFERQFEKQTEQELTPEDKVAQAVEVAIDEKTRGLEQTLSERERQWLDILYRMKIFEKDF